MGDIYKTAKGKSLVVTRQDYIKIIIALPALARGRGMPSPP